MSFAATMQLAAYILTNIWAIAPDYRQPYALALANMLTGINQVDKEQAEVERKASTSYFAAAYGTGYEFTYQTDFFGSPIDKQMLDKLPEGSVAIHPFTSAIIKHDQYCGPQGVVSKMRGMLMADRHPNIKAHIIKVESPGGSAVTMLNTSNDIKNLKKPVVAFVDDLSASAAYGISSATQYIVANSDIARIGSIGTMATWFDEKAYLESRGIKTKDLYADASVDKNDVFRAAVEGNFEPLKAELNKYNNLFLSMVENNRKDKLTAGKDVWGTGKLYDAKEALSLGLIDDIGSLDSVIKSLINN